MTFPYSYVKLNKTKWCFLSVGLNLSVGGFMRKREFKNPPAPRKRRGVAFWLRLK
jgi:hypothetical protein